MILDRLIPAIGVDDPHALLILRAALAALISLLVSLAAGRPVIAYLRRLKIAERTEKTPIEDENLRRRIIDKSGTPTMGGIILLAGVLAGCLAGGNVADPPLGLTLLCMLALSLLGVADDRLKLAGKGHRERGLKPWHKLAYQACAGGMAGALLIRRTAAVAGSGFLSLVPLLQTGAFFATIVVMGWAALLVTTLSNATNVTDGLDGLLAGLAAIASATLAGACIFLGGPNAGPMSVFFASMAGACLGFLWFNRHPARVFMGDTGSLAVGGGMACAALAARMELLLLVAGLVFLVEFGSSLLQMGWFKVFRKRILPIAPIHHIPQRMDMPERRIVRGFYFGGGVAALMGLTLLWT